MTDNNNNGASMDPLVALELKNLKEGQQRTNQILDSINQTLGKLATIEQRAHTQESELQDHEQRIRTLEKGRWKLLGGIGVIAVAATTFIGEAV